MVTQDLIHFIQQELTSGKSVAFIEQELSQQGWKKDEIHSGLARAQNISNSTRSSSQFAYASLDKRVFAYIIDMLLLFIPLILIVAIFTQSVKLPTITQNPIEQLLWYVILFGYYVYFTFHSGSTIGKRIMHLQVVRVDGKKLGIGTVLLRETIGKILSNILDLGYFIAFFTDKRQALHDLIAQTVVIDTSRPYENQPNTAFLFLFFLFGSSEVLAGGGYFLFLSFILRKVDVSHQIIYPILGIFFAIVLICGVIQVLYALVYLHDSLDRKILKQKQVGFRISLFSVSYTLGIVTMPIFLVIIVFSALSQVNHIKVPPLRPPQTTPSHMKNYTNGQLGMAFQYPDKYALVPVDDPYHLFPLNLSVIPATESAGTQMEDQQTHLYVGAISYSLPLETYIQKVSQTNASPSAKMIGSEHGYEFFHVVEPTAQNQTSHITILDVIKHGANLIEFSIDGTNPQQFGEYLSVMNQMEKSLVLSVSPPLTPFPTGPITPQISAVKQQ